MTKLRIKFIPYEKVEEKKVEHILDEIEKDTIIMIDAKLSAEQETELIEETMKKISDKFKGIELGSMEFTPAEEAGILARIRNRVVETVVGRKRGMTVIGPAKLIKRIKRQPKALFLEMSA
ncbi:MAG: DUF2073 domain-containing protein [Candidatus Aenigmarchaeota archaeon]|nr:DUF2073 domain-containing protein [Candidatus Aenigmarchaeota archaeon]